MAAVDTTLVIVDTAIDLFWRAGYHATSMNDLSRVAGVNKATVYQHFRSKEDLAIAAIGRAAERTRNHVFEGAFEQANDPVGRLRAIHRRFHDTHQLLFEREEICPGCPFVNIGMELAVSSEGVRRAVNAAFALFAPYYVSIISDLRDSGTLKPIDTTDDLAADLQANMNASLVASKLEMRPAAIIDGGERAVHMLTG